ncbi:MAG: hypothetical protein JXX29_12895 [Deltaproteobacteria bacterium]|nr:hypothetical protein [Deltaproteobacteria bacterium]MBN2672574.1 hypothetical protein [Deltaproteobacteria bacterium]
MRCPASGAVNPFSTETSDNETDDGAGAGAAKISIQMDHAAVMEKREKKCTPYAYSNDYAPGDYFHHKTFGDGYVLFVLPSDKMTVLFSDQKRLLRCGPNSKKEEVIQFGSASSPYNNPPALVESEKQTEKKKRTARKVGNSGADDAPRECPKCGKTVHPYNLTKNPSGKVVACMNCKGR